MGYRDYLVQKEKKTQTKPPASQAGTSGQGSTGETSEIMYGTEL